MWQYQQTLTLLNPTTRVLRPSRPTSIRPQRYRPAGNNIPVRDAAYLRGTQMVVPISSPKPQSFIVSLWTDLQGKKQKPPDDVCAWATTISALSPRILFSAPPGSTRMEVDASGSALRGRWNIYILYPRPFTATTPQNGRRWSHDQIKLSWQMIGKGQTCGEQQPHVLYKPVYGPSAGSFHLASHFIKVSPFFPTDTAVYTHIRPSILRGDPAR